MRYFVKLSMCVMFATLCHVLQADLVATRKWTERRLQETVSTNNADFVSAVTNCPVVVSGQSDAVMTYALDLMNAVSGGAEPPTVEEFREGLPKMVWTA